VENGIVVRSNGVLFLVGDGAPAPFVSRREPRTLHVRDRDGDGWMDDLERLLGSSPESAASKPAGFREAPRVNAIDSLAPHVKSVRTARGQLVLSGELPVSTGGWATERISPGTQTEAQLITEERLFV
jgi:hypothetical protein